MVLGTLSVRDGVKNDRKWKCAAFQLEEKEGRVWQCRAWNQQADEMIRYHIGDGYQLTASFRQERPEELTVVALIIKQRAVERARNLIEIGTQKGDDVFVTWSNGEGKIIRAWKRKSDCVQDKDGNWCEMWDYIYRFIDPKAVHAELKSIASLTQAKSPAYIAKVQELLELARNFENNPVG